MLIFTRPFLVALLERAIKTAAQMALAVVVGSEVTSAITLDWPLVAGAAGLGFVLSALSSVASAGVGPGESPSVTEDR